MVLSKSIFDLIAIEVCSWTPHLETVCEICLREAAAGKRVAFVFLDSESPDFYPKIRRVGKLAYPFIRKARFAKVALIERILREHGVTVLLRPQKVNGRRVNNLSFQRLGVNSVEQLCQYRYRGGHLGLGILSSLISHLGDTEPDLTENRSLVDQYLMSAQVTYDCARLLLDQYRPAEILLFNGRLACSKAIVEAARATGTSVLFCEVGATHDRFYLSTRPPQSMANGRRRLRELWDNAGPEKDSIANQYYSLGRGGARLLEAQFRNPQVRGLGLPDQGCRRRIVYFSSSDDEHAAVSDGIEPTIFESQRDAVCWLVRWVGSEPDAELVIRVHPRMCQLSARERAWWNQFHQHNVITIPENDPVDSYTLARSAQVVVCHRSSMGPEATYLGKPSILVGDALYRGLGCVYEPQSIEELRQLLDDQGLQAKPREACLPYGYYRMMHGERFQYYKPTSFSAGSFFGEDVARDSATWISKLLEWLPRLRRMISW